MISIFYFLMRIKFNFFDFFFKKKAKICDLKILNFHFLKFKLLKKEKQQIIIVL